MDAESTPPDEREGGLNNLQCTQDSQLLQGHTVEERAAQRLSLTMVDSCWMSSPAPSLDYEREAR